MSPGFGTKKQPTGDYEVGYAKPPKSGQWQKGQSGNPKGRRKDRLIRDYYEAYHEAGQEIVSVPIRGKLRRMTLVQAEAYKARFAAGSGDGRARAHVLRVEQIYAQRKSAGAAEGGWTIIHARPVFEEEENRLVQLTEDKRTLTERVKYLEERLASCEQPDLTSEGRSAVYQPRSDPS